MYQTRHQDRNDDQFDNKAKALRKVERNRRQEEEADEELRSLRGGDPRSVLRSLND